MELKTNQFYKFKLEKRNLENVHVKDSCLQDWPYWK